MADNKDRKLIFKYKYTCKLSHQNPNMNTLTPNLSLQQYKELINNYHSFFEDSTIGETALHIQNDPELIRYILDNEHDPNETTMMGNTPLHYKRSPEVVKILLEYGADPNSKNSYGNTPLHKQTDTESVKLLLQHGAKLDIKNELGKLPVDVNDKIYRGISTRMKIRILQSVVVLGFLCYYYYF